MAQDNNDCAIALAVVSAPDGEGYCINMTISVDGVEHTIQGSLRYPSSSEANADGVVLLGHLQRIIGKAPKTLN